MHNAITININNRPLKLVMPNIFKESQTQNSNYIFCCIAAAAVESKWKHPSFNYFRLIRDNQIRERMYDRSLSVSRTVLTANHITPKWIFKESEKVINCFITLSAARQKRSSIMAIIWNLIIKNISHMVDKRRKACAPLSICGNHNRKYKWIIVQGFWVACLRN